MCNSKVLRSLLLDARSDLVECWLLSGTLTNDSSLKFGTLLKRSFILLVMHFYTNVENKLQLVKLEIFKTAEKHLENLMNLTSQSPPVYTYAH